MSRTEYIPVSLIPAPKEIKGPVNSEGKYKAREYKTTIWADDGWKNARDAFCTYAGKLQGIKFIFTRNADMQILKDDGLAPGAYEIKCGDHVKISASDETGINYGLSTLLQLINKSDNGLYLPEVYIYDYPDSSYRGMLVDLARNWHGFEYLLRYVDMCYFYKISVLHLHFTDTQSYTLPSELYPGLPTKNRHYTKEQISLLADYAHERGVQIMPEIDVPGHSSPFQDKYKNIFGTNGIIHQHENSMKAMEKIFQELCGMFPYSKYIHIGGDEADIEKWTDCCRCRRYAKRKGAYAAPGNKKLLAQQMYAHFVSRMANVIFQNKRIPIVWEGFAKEVNDLVSKDIIVMSWENYYQTTPDLLNAGFKIINCSWAPLYIVTPGIHWPQEQIFNWDIYTWKPVHGGSPYPDGLKIAPDINVLGGQILAWGDRIMTEYENIEDGVREELKLLLERLPALAEKTWNVKGKRGYDDFTRAFEKTSGDLNKLLGLI